jgi:hypothetical protein
MSHYRLLRDNKESGPFSEQEMIAKGFKPYDLIWVEGRSAGWRYPSEIPAFSGFAPVVEEQPYDRFYKKQQPQELFQIADRPVAQARQTYASPANLGEQKPVAEPSVVQTALPHYHPMPSIPAKNIHVTLPSGNSINLQQLVMKADSKQQQALAAMAAEPEAYGAAKPATVLLKTTIAAPVDASTVKLADVEQFQQRRAVAAFPWSLAAAAFIGIATLVGLGIMIGLSINRERNDKAFNEALLSKSRQNSSSSIRSLPPVANTVADQPSSVSTESLNAGSKELVRNAVVKTNPASDNGTAQKKLTEEKPLQPESTNPAEQEPAPVVKSKPVPVNIEQHLAITPNDFRTGAFGGISGLKYTLFNGSRLPLESVEVEVSYITANDKVFKTARLLFKDIAAGSQAVIDAPASNRGVKVSSRIIKVNPKETVLVNTTARS